MATELVKMSSKGQLVVPQNIREELGLSAGERFIAVPQQDGVLFKKVDLDFDRLAREVSRRFRSKGITKKDVAEAVKWARTSSSTRTS